MVVLQLLVCVLLQLALSNGAPDEYRSDLANLDVNNRDTRQTLRFGQKIRKKSRDLENVDSSSAQVQAPDFDNYGDYLQPPSSTQLPINFGTKTKNGRVVSKIMIRTFKTTTSAPEQEQEQEYENQEISTTAAPTTTSTSYTFYNNPYVSRKPSVPPKKVFEDIKKLKPSTARTTTTTTHRPTHTIKMTKSKVVLDIEQEVPSASFQVHQHQLHQNHPQQNQNQPQPQRKVKLSNRPVTTPIPSQQYTFPPYTGTSAATTTTAKNQRHFDTQRTTSTTTKVPRGRSAPPSTSTPQNQPHKTVFRGKDKHEKYVHTSRPTTKTTTTTTEAPEALESSEQEEVTNPEVYTTPYQTTLVPKTTPRTKVTSKVILKTSTSPPVRVYTKTFKPVYKLNPDVEAPEIELAPPTTKTVKTTPKSVSTPPKKLHYIITVIGGSSTPNPGNSTEEVEEEIIEEEEDYTTLSPDESNSTVTEKPDPYAHLETIDIPESAIHDPLRHSPPYEFIPSISKNRPLEQTYHFSNYQQFPQNQQNLNQFRHQPQISQPTFVNSNKFLNFDTPNFKQNSHRQNEPQLIPLRTVVSYQPENSNGNSNSGGIIGNTNSHQNNQKNSFVSSKTVLYYTQVHPAISTHTILPNSDPSAPIQKGNLSPVANSLSSSPTIQHIPPIVSSSSALTTSNNNIISNSNSNRNRISSPIPAQSYYLENIGERHQRSQQQGFGRSIPLLVDLVPN